ncbi:MAG: substrate-binding domain-containing protein, partial [Gammaproteobacteria bacterium]|nr:substrate-binding domain-containing protein [Gammaproteobacteria bacterium]
GVLGPRVAPVLIRLLDGTRDQLWLMEQRTLGLVSRPDRPVTSVSELAGQGVRFINRQPGAGTRLVFDELLADAGIAGADVLGYEEEEYSHNAVAALVASGSADAGFACEAAAARMRLKFTPFLDERFYLVASRGADSRLRRTIGEFCVAQSFTDQGGPQPEEMQPTLPVLKRVHRAGFWKK